MNYDDLLEIGKAFMVLFAVIDILGSIPVIIKIKKKSGDIHPLKASLVALGIMLGFLFIGESLLGFLVLTQKRLLLSDHLSFLLWE